MNSTRAKSQERTGKRFLPWTALVVVAGLTVGGGPPGGATSALAANEPQTSPHNALAFDLKEVSVFEILDPLRIYFTSGAYMLWHIDPNAQVTRYPAFASSKPLYGSLLIGATSGSRDSGLRYHFAVDESAGTGRGYDRLYFDANRNNDLTDDGHKGVQNVSDDTRFSSTTFKEKVCFEDVLVQIDPNDPPQRRLAVMPRLLIFRDSEDRGYVTFVTTRAHQGLIELDGRKFRVFLGHSRQIPGWFDHPSTGLYITPADSSNRGPTSSVTGTLSALRKCGDRFYCFSATPAGDRLFVRPYEGPLGTLEVGAGGRNVGSMSLTGSLRSQDTALSLSENLGSGDREPRRSHRLPVGDYSPFLVSVTYGQLRCAVMRNYHADGRPRGALAGQAQDHTIKIRADKPFVLDFSNKPDVLFALPARDLCVKRGQEVNVKAVLIDPALNLMFRYLRQERQLDPKVAIKRANGEVVAEGVMPFG